ncbi:MAG: class I SAM-dependent methyltransferase [Dehalococcoidia bacterium]|nr:MAG: class I SAM-dependent methyltransferase [Dehalococcoidia bacterium]
MRKIELDELPKYSPWVARLLNIDPFPKPERTIAKIDAEYDKDKFAKLLQFYEQNPGIGIEELRSVEEDFLPPERELCVSQGNELFLMTAANVQRQDRQIILDSLLPYMTENRIVIELGCGYGYNLGVLTEAEPDHLFIGGDYSQNAVKLARKLFKDCPEANISKFNFYDQIWSIFDAVAERALVFTNHAIEQLPSAKSVMSILAKYREKIACVIHLEPVFEFNDPNTTLGLMRQSYTLINDYNKDLFTCLEGMGVKMLKVEKDLFGPNPLNPTSLIVWQF